VYLDCVRSVTIGMDFDQETFGISLFEFICLARLLFAVGKSRI